MKPLKGEEGEGGAVAAGSRRHTAEQQHRERRHLGRQPGQQQPRLRGRGRRGLAEAVEAAEAAHPASPGKRAGGSGKHSREPSGRGNLDGVGRRDAEPAGGGQDADGVDGVERRELVRLALPVGLAQVMMIAVIEGADSGRKILQSDEQLKCDSYWKNSQKTMCEICAVLFGYCDAGR